MNEIIGEQIKYILVQTNTTEGQQNPRQAVYYNEYNLSLNTVSEVNQATKFEDLETVQGVAGLQNQMAVLLKKPFNYTVVKEETSRTEME